MVVGRNPYTVIFVRRSPLRLVPLSATMTSLTELAIGILADARQLDEYTNSKGLGYSTFEIDTLSDLPPGM